VYKRGTNFARPFHMTKYTRHLQSFMKNPWKTLRAKIVYDNPWMQVTHREVINPSGNAGIYGVVHFKNVAIAIVPLDEKNNTWLVGQYRYTLEQFSWEVPEGGGNPGEPVLLAAQRELEEETGITAKSWIEIGALHPSNSITDERGVVFVAKDLTIGTPNPDDTELLEVRKIPLDEAVEMVLRGEITDALAVSAILKVKMLIDRGQL